MQWILRKWKKLLFIIELFWDPRRKWAIKQRKFIRHQRVSEKSIYEGENEIFLCFTSMAIIMMPLTFYIFVKILSALTENIFQCGFCRIKSFFGFFTQKIWMPTVWAHKTCWKFPRKILSESVTLLYAIFVSWHRNSILN